VCGCKGYSNCTRLHTELSSHSFLCYALSGMERTFTLHLYLQGNEGPVFPETFYFVSKHPAGDNLQVHHSSELAYGSTP
jgi:hypothetical protein